MAMVMMMMMETEEVMVVMGEDMDGMEDMTGVAVLLQEEVEDWHGDVVVDKDDEQQPLSWRSGS